MTGRAYQGGIAAESGILAGMQWTPELILAALAALLAGVAVVLGLLILNKLGAASGSRLEGALREELRSARAESATGARDLREEVARSMAATSDQMIRVMDHLSTTQRTRLKEMEDGLERFRKTLQGGLEGVSNRNEAKLEEIRKTVDEQLHGTLEKRLGESFRLVSGNLERVHQGLGEMRTLAEGVGDLKKVLSNVKVRGTWGEVQLGAILEQVLTPEQFDRNVKVRRDSADHVEFAVKLPGPGGGVPVWLPLDSKFPQEPYQRLVEATEGAPSVAAPSDAIQGAVAELIRAVRLSARTIQEKYIAPPHTTDFAVLFLPTEGLYGEVLRQPGLLEELQDRYRVVVAGPTTLAALLNSLRMGFRTLALQEQAGEVWRVLGAVKTEFGKFGGVLEKVKRQLHTASRTIDETGVRTRAMERHLRAVEEVPTEEAARLLGVEEDAVSRTGEEE
jgi:DNA recombination protein RmuC